MCFITTKETTMEACKDCPEIKKVEFQIDSLELVVQRTKIEVDSVRQTQEARDIEHEAMIQGLSMRMDMVKTELDSFKKDINAKFEGLDKSVTSSLEKMELSIPKMFEQSMNALLARIGKGLINTLGVIVAITLSAVTRPIILSALREIEHRIEQVNIGDK
jgi:SMC interacting uncharacterized protein involved in chromosome segregation